MSSLPWSIIPGLLVIAIASHTVAAQSAPEDPRVPPEVAIQTEDYATRHPGTALGLDHPESGGAGTGQGLDVQSLQVEGGHESSVPEAMALSIAFFQETAPR